MTCAENDTAIVFRSVSIFSFRIRLVCVTVPVNGAEQRVRGVVVDVAPATCGEHQLYQRARGEVARVVRRGGVHMHSHIKQQPSTLDGPIPS